MSSLGYNGPFHMFLAFTITGFFAGVVGALYALFNNFVSPSTVVLSQSVEWLLMAIIGGVGTLFGAFIGSAIIILLANLFIQYSARKSMILSFMCILIMILATEGILGSIHKFRNRKQNQKIGL